VQLATEPAATAAALDPLVLALFSVLGVVITLAGGLVGARIQSKREHKKWLRERRFEAYTKFLAYMDRAIDLTEKFKNNAPDLTRHLEELTKHKPDALGPIQLLGPKAVRAASKQYVDVIRINPTSFDMEDLKTAKESFLAAMRDAVDIDD
jgi:hypothetical protein